MIQTGEFVIAPLQHDGNSLFFRSEVSRIPRSVVGVCGGIPGDVETNPNYRPFDAETLYLYGNEDEFYSEERFSKFDEKLNSMLPNYRSKRYEAKHEITEEMRADIMDFLVEMSSV